MKLFKGLKFSSKPRNGYDHVYELVDIKPTLQLVVCRNTSFPTYDDRGKVRFVAVDKFLQNFEKGDYVVLK